MLINLFDVEDRKLTPSNACYAIPWLERIMKLYPDNYIQIYKYIFFTTCPDGTINPYVNLPEDEREEVIISDIGPLKFSLEDPIILDTIERCKKLYETASYRGFLGVKVMLDKIADYLAQTEITEGKEANGMQIDRFLSKSFEYREQFSKWENKLKEEQSKVKGDRVIPFHQQSGYKETKSYE